MVDTHLIVFFFHRGFYPFIRYSYSSTFDWADAQLTIDVSGNSGITPESCPQTPGTQVWTSTMIFVPGAGLAARPTDSMPVGLDRRCTYTVSLDMRSNGAGESKIEIDSLLLMPDINETLVHQVAGKSKGFYIIRNTQRFLGDSNT